MDQEGRERPAEQRVLGDQVARVVDRLERERAEQADAEQPGQPGAPAAPPPAAPPRRQDRHVRLVGLDHLVDHGRRR
jgi:hypothetical protein